MSNGYLSLGFDGSVDAFGLSFLGRGTTSTAYGAIAATGDPANPDFSLSVSPNPLLVPAGGKGATATVTVSANESFYQGLTLSFSGQKSGNTVTLSPSYMELQPHQTGTATLTIKRSLFSSGTYTLTIKGTSTAGIVHTTTLSVKP
jgi:hypothetical protein